MIQIGWVDFSKEHRKRVLNVLSFLTQRGEIDELGISRLRGSGLELSLTCSCFLSSKEKSYITRLDPICVKYL